ncbi:hypothetical protein [Chelativorans salis]|uniref:Uncharacterized protein n=1 Tax=Chelativorans salis TaxID=2978478 RepID=A0ABT2LH38_9HYPH|nr:hypothetical protein [Chelativorans sp. EGI FJ00035]MCT7373539.1 hypothetical protein [Chelativorans sp. EGI FJ00035]
MDRLAGRDSDTPALPLEIVELELALQHQDFLQTGFEGAVLLALERIGGRMLFRMRMNGMAGCDWIAAVALEGGGEETVALVAQPAEGGPLRVEDAATSDLPVARIAKAYAEIMGRLDTPPAQASDAQEDPESET